MKTLSALVTVAVISIAMIACSKASDGPSNAAPNSNSNSAAKSDAGPANSSPVAANNTAPAISSEKTESVYTDITTEKCKTTSSNEKEQWIVQMCAGVEGYKLEVYEDDIRQSMNVVPPQGKKSELNFQGTVASGFSSLGDKAEWRIETKDGKKVPRALIVRFNVADPEDPSKSTSYLVVSKISAEKSCVTDVVSPSADQNEEARRLADGASTKACKANNQ
jgi:hypothetical protein